MNLDLNQLVKWRREFHRFPEIGWSEFWTTSRIADYLEDLGCFEIFLGKQIINPDFVRGRKQAVVDKGLANAKAYGANEKWLEKWKGTLVVWHYLIQVNQEKPLRYVLISTV